uniref:Uncharacterized protein n=1 Tax=Helicotheca tamesis TaxID=374047 RepID=A0A7S2GWS3_9STRA|mmetsp:Transcript_12930/g.17776  ORF Transcript_12930/g.17776 Transcript_12930/m.17776 type:complete len:103 (+) Transcript_12930:74-382(+)|eukprot:CAMPEP_0185724136 /NCGR_PEP_ID=MMETSP1171-20130828/705_1 /TAXON_ID=374046 /ORGANISM="Helicotheca tamensis, Strain CCMP826" /LENGTH=102 /DNA_ID=CAMNT_0028391921 /DNA_START=58 /DNA_END=366 /DNA_ORIENTATION=+
MIVATRTAATAVARTASRSPKVVNGQQKRGVVDWMTNYPDKIAEIKKVQCAGGTCQGEKNPTWLKQPGDVGVALFGAALVGYGVCLSIAGHWRLATGKGKLD